MTRGSITNGENIWSGRRDSNPRPQPWQGCALPLSYARSERDRQAGPGKAPDRGPGQAAAASMGLHARQVPMEAANLTASAGVRAASGDAKALSKDMKETVMNGSSTMTAQAREEIRFAYGS